MSSKKKKNKKKVKITENKKSQSPLFSFYSRQFVLIIISVLIVFLCYYKITGYKWVVDGIIINNLKIIMRYPNMTIEKKWAAKLGFDYNFLEYIKKNTPLDAVILFPPDSVLFPKGKKTDFNRGAQSIKNKAWSKYFLYPRKIVYEYEKDSNPLFYKIDYVAIVNKWGYQYLKYSPQRKHKYQILPLDKKN